MKHDWRKHAEDLAGVKITPALVEIPEQQFIMISGAGNPNDADFTERISALYSLAYAIKMAHKKETAEDFSVYPLEGVWEMAEDGVLAKDKLRYTIMIRQPACIGSKRVEIALAVVRKKKPTPLYDEIVFGTMEDGRCIQLVHVGSYDDEPASFARMDAYAAQSGYVRAESRHREIYLNNAQKTAPDKRKTILRYKVEAL